MNKLSIDEKTQVVQLLVEGNSIRSTERITGIHRDTIMRLLCTVGKACQRFHDENVKHVNCQKIQADEVWSFVYSKQKNTPAGMEGEAGDVWTWTAICADSKLVVSWLVGARDADTANVFMNDVAGRLSRRVQLTTDGFKPYLEAVTESFGSQIDFAMLVKLYGKESPTANAERKYSPSECIGIKKNVVSGNPDPKHISTSYVERSNLTMRMHMRRFTRLTNAFSKKVENHCHAIALHFFYYNWVKQHKTLRATPAMAAGLSKRFMTIEDIVRMTEK